MSKYKVGYGKPPKKYQFKPGQSGNKKGRPKKSNNAMTILNKRLASNITVKEGERKVQISKLDALVMQTINAGLKGNLKATSMIFDLLDKKGLMDNVNMDNILPENHQEILDAFVKKKAKERKARKKAKRKKERNHD